MHFSCKRYFNTILIFLVWDKVETHQIQWGEELFRHFTIDMVYKILRTLFMR